MRTLLIFCIALLVSSYLCPAVSDPDLWWHIVVGRWIIENQTLPSVDLWTQFGSGELWRAYSWLFEIAVAVIDQKFSTLGLVVAQLGLVLLLFYALHLAYYSLSKDIGFSLFLATYSLAAIYNHISLRPQLAVWSLAGALIYLLSSDRISSARIRIASLALIICLWANLHISTIFGLLIIYAWSRKEEPLKLRLLYLGVPLVASLLTPYLGGEWRTMFETASHPLLHDAVVEFKPATFTQYPTIFVLLLLVVSALFLFRAETKIAFPKLAVSLLFLIAGLSFVKFLPFAVICLAAINAELWRDSGVRRDNLGVGFEKLLSTLSRLPIQGITFFLLCIVALNLKTLISRPLDLQHVPEKALDFAIAHQLPTPFLNTFGHGGYISYRYALSSAQNGEEQESKMRAPELQKRQIKVSIDGRTNLISAKLWRAFINALNGREGWEEYIELVKPRTIFWIRESPFSNLLRLARDRWCEVYRDGKAERGEVIFIERNFAETSALKCLN